MPDIFQTLRIGDLTLPNRVVMAPLTRTRTKGNHVPSHLMVDHYAQRATGGLLIAEATMVAEGHSAFAQEPGIYNTVQVAAWRDVTEAVHARGGRIFLQLIHGGRASHPAYNNDLQPLAPSAIRIQGEVNTPTGKLPYVTPRALLDSEIPLIVEAFRSSAANAKAAGFDGIEIHGANGFLIDQFLRTGSNNRTGRYGGSIENRARLLFEILNAVIAEWGSNRVGLRLSPINGVNDMRDENPLGLTSWLAEALNSFDLAYLHVMRGDFRNQQTGDVLSIARKKFSGVLIANMGYTPEEAIQSVANGSADAIAFGTAYLANPDLPERIQRGVELNKPDPSTFYGSGAAGYNDYSVMHS
ncbi:alkene reductase [Xanthomonas arboricola pv. zantedeschiae]|uniref:alkene reductase n=1 Tax=Xanthomonas arboricola TaxID=56448 RepID=UPI000CEEA96C|nr:alkene reductase [Xanthomonas arboricola]PPT84741.1 alkene reductase [Xanthomonas arboricola pv. zantedeschiae]